MTHVEVQRLYLVHDGLNTGRASKVIRTDGLLISPIASAAAARRVGPAPRPSATYATASRVVAGCGASVSGRENARSPYYAAHQMVGERTGDARG